MRGPNWKVSRKAALSEKREYRRLSAAESQPEKDESIYQAVQCEMSPGATDDPCQGKRGALSRVARRKKMTPQNVGQRVRAHERLESELEAAEKSWAMIAKLKKRGA